MTSDPKDKGEEAEMVDRCVSEIETTLDDFAEEWDATDETIDTAVFTAAVERAVDANLEKEQFIAMLEEMFDESREMTDLQDRMSLTRGES